MARSGMVSPVPRRELTRKPPALSTNRSCVPPSAGTAILAGEMRPAERHADEVVAGLEAQRGAGVAMRGDELRLAVGPGPVAEDMPHEALLDALPVLGQQGDELHLARPTRRPRQASRPSMSAAPPSCWGAAGCSAPRAAGPARLEQGRAAGRDWCRPARERHPAGHEPAPGQAARQERCRCQATEQDLADAPCAAPRCNADSRHIRATTSSKSEATMLAPLAQAQSAVISNSLASPARRSTARS